MWKNCTNITNTNNTFVQFYVTQHVTIPRPAMSISAACMGATEHTRGSLLNSYGDTKVKFTVSKDSRSPSVYGLSRNSGL